MIRPYASGRQCDSVADEKEIAAKRGRFAVVMADINNLKYVNDTFGHEKGDQYIRGCCKIICRIFAHSPVYRIGGDEFVIILQDHDYDQRQLLSAKTTFKRADAEMYAAKEKFKERNGSYR